MAKRTKPEKNQGILKVTCNGHTLEGVKRDGGWSWSCPSWPDLAEKYQESRDGSEILTEFMVRVMTANGRSV